MSEANTEKDMGKLGFTGVLLFPFTAYVFLGTTLLFATSKLYEFSLFLGRYGELPGIDELAEASFHDKSLFVCQLFPITWPFITLIVFGLFVYTALGALLVWFWRRLVEIYRWTVRQLDRFWKWASRTSECGDGRWTEFRRRIDI